MRGRVNSSLSVGKIRDGLTRKRHVGRMGGRAAFDLIYVWHVMQWYIPASDEHVLQTLEEIVQEYSQQPLAYAAPAPSVEVGARHQVRV